MEDSASLFSDESSFYGGWPGFNHLFCLFHEVLRILIKDIGDEEEVLELERRTYEFNPREYWNTSHSSSPAIFVHLQQESETKGNTGQYPKEKSVIEKKVRSQHSHDGREECHQSTETIPAFLKRLPPSITPVSTIGPWIFVADRKAPEDDLDVRGFNVAGNELLQAFEDQVSLLKEKHMDNQSRVGLTRSINAERRKLEPKLLQAARKHNVILGKWMLFPPLSKVDKTWAAVAGATAKGKLGVGAKVATKPEFEGANNRRLICVYTKDFADKEDLRNIVIKLENMGLVTRERPIYYKSDAYTWLDISTSNRWGIKPTMHSSTEILARKW